jgi:tetratricopeptide (TPR) repeat protein
MAYILRVRGDLAGAMGLYEQSLAIDESLGDKQGKSATLHAMANIYVTRGDLAGAMGLYEQSLAIQESLGDKKGKAATLHEMAYILRVRGDLAGAMGLYEQSLAIKESLGDKQGKSATLHAMANVAMARGEWEKAKEWLDTAMALASALDDAQGVAFIVVKQGQVSQARGDKNAALECYRQGLAGFARLGMPRETAQVEAMIAELENGDAKRDLSLEEWVRRSTRAARGLTADGQTWFELARQVSSDRNAPAEICRLAEVLLSLLAGKTNPDLSGLPAELAELVQSALAE